MRTLAEKRAELTSRLNSIRNSQDRLALIVREGRQRPPLPPEFRSDAFKVEGCLANLWFAPSYSDGLCHFRSDADSVIVKSVAAIVCDFYSGHSPEEILAMDPSFLAEVGITQHLSPNRLNGLSRLWERIREFARERRSTERAEPR